MQIDNILKLSNETFLTEKNAKIIFKIKSKQFLTEENFILFNGYILKFNADKILFFR